MRFARRLTFVCTTLIWIAIFVPLTAINYLINGWAAVRDEVIDLSRFEPPP